MQLPFGRARALEAQVDAFLDLVAQGVLVMQEAVRAYIAGEIEEFEDRFERISDLESQADDVSRSVETALYTWSLLPESRGDVLQILEETDSIIDMAKGILGKFEVEMPEIPPEFRAGFLSLLDKSVAAADKLVVAVRAYFQDLNQVKDPLNKVYFYEGEADRAALKLKKAIFRSEDLDLSHKAQLRYFADKLEQLSDLAEDVAAILGIATIKRSV